MLYGLLRFQRSAALVCRYRAAGAIYAIRHHAEEIRPEDISFDDGDASPASGPSIITSFEDVSSLDQFSRARVLNFIKRCRGSKNEKKIDMNIQFEIKEVRISDETHYRARIEIPFGGVHGTQFGEGLSSTMKDSETLASMHAQAIIDSLGFQLYTLPSMQRKHAQSRRDQGQWAPMPEDSPRDPQEVSLPKPLRRIVDRDESEDGMWQLISVRQLNFAAPSHTMLSPAILDSNALHRIRLLFKQLQKSFDEALSVSEVVPTNSASPLEKMIEASITLPLPPAYGRVVAKGRAVDKNTSIVLACMHCELIIDTLGFPLFIGNPDLQTQHAQSARGFGRWAPIPGDAHMPPSTAIPRPLKQLALKPGGAPRVSVPSDEEQLVMNHLKLIEESANFTPISVLDQDAPRMLVAFLASQGSRRLDPFFVEKVGSVYRATVALPLDPQLGVRGGVGIGNSSAEAQVLCSMHAIEVINTLGGRLISDEVAQAHYIEKRKRSGLPVPDESETVSARAMRLSPAPLKKASPQNSKPVNASPSVDRAFLRSQVREYRLREMEGKQPSLNESSVGKRQYLKATQRRNYKAQQADVDRHHWCLEADTSDGFIVVSPAQKMDNSVSFGHTIVSPRQLDLLARERIVAYLAGSGRRADHSFRTEKVPTPDGQTFFRCRITLPVPDAFGERVAVGEAPESRDAECLAAMHAELIIDCLGLPLYSDRDLQQKHAEAARGVGRFAPLPSQSPQPSTTLSPPALRKERSDSIRWLKHVQQKIGSNAKVQLDSDSEAREKREAAYSSFIVLTEDQIDSNSKARVQNYLRRTLKSPEAVEHRIESSFSSINHICKMQVPVPEQFGERYATGMALSKKEAEALCYMHAERIIDTLGLKLFNLPGLQTRHVQRVKKEGRWAPLPTEDADRPGDTASPPPFRIDKLGPKPQHPEPPAMQGLTATNWRKYIKACEDYIEERLKHDRERAIADGKVPATGDTLVDEALAEVDRSELARQVKSDLYNYCFRANLTYPTYWRTQTVGPTHNRLIFTTVEVPGFEHMHACGLGKNKDISSRKAAMHAIAILRRLDPDFAAHEFSASADAMNQRDHEMPSKKKHDQGSWDRMSGSFTQEGKTRLIELYTVCNGLGPPRIMHKQRHEGPFIIYTTMVEVVDTDGMCYIGRAQQSGARLNAASAYDEVFAKMVRSIPAFRSLMQLLKKHPHLDPEHIMSITVPKYIEEKIASVTDEIEDGDEDVERAEENNLQDPQTKTLANRFATDPARAERRSELLKRRHESKLVNEKYISDFFPRRSTLSIHGNKQYILDTIAANPVTVICGTTGCGKTTQVPQYLLDEAAEKGEAGKVSIIVTQPRRITAISIAQRVSAERLESLGDEVGYAIRLDSKPGKAINFCTSGILLRIFQASPDLEGISHVIIDEIHERDINSDFLLILVKELIKRRPDVRVILMSATLQSELFSKYFADAPTINVEGYVYPVEELYLEDIALAAKEKGLVAPSFKAALTPPTGEPKLQKQRYGFSEAIEPIDFAALVFAVDYASTKMDLGNSSILVFLPGWDDIVKAREQLSTGKFHIIALHSSVSSEEQMECFRPPPPGKVKLILSTNIAESGVTIDDVGVVIDLGRAKEKSFVMRRGRTSVGRNEFGSMSQLITIFASRANCTQRRGRAGRTKEGMCIRMYTRKHWHELPDFQVPEMLRQPLDSLCLQILALSLGDPADFLQRALEPPPVESIESSMLRLKNLGAVNIDRQLTPLGARLATLPVLPWVGKMILLGTVLECLDSVLTIAAAMDLDPFISHRDWRDIVKVHRDELSCNSQSDHIAILNAFNLWATAVATKTPKEVEAVIGENVLHKPSLRQISRYKRQFFEILAATGFAGNSSFSKKSETFVDNSKHSSDATDIGLVKGVICAGLFPNVALSREKKVYRNKLDNLLSPHPASVIAKLAFEKITNPYFVYEELVRSSTDVRVFFRGASNISMWAILLLGTSNLHIQYRDDLNLGIIDDWIVFRATIDTLEMIKRLKRKLNMCIARKFAAPEDEVNSGALAKLKEIIQLLCNLPTRPNDLVSTVWEERGLITEAVPETLKGISEAEVGDEEPSSAAALVMDEEGGADAVKDVAIEDEQEELSEEQQEAGLRRGLESAVKREMAQASQQ